MRTEDVRRPSLAYGTEDIDLPIGTRPSKAAVRQATFLMSRGLRAAGAEPEYADGPAERGGTRRASERAKARIPRPRSPLPYLHAFRAKRRMAPPPQPAAWRELGPTRITNGQTYGGGRTLVSGRVARVAIDPADQDHVLIASAGGGVWGSWNAGDTWAPLTDDQPSMSCGAIAFAPSDPAIVYCGTGEGDSRSPLGAGILRSTDGGRHWTARAATILSGAAFFDLSIDPADPDLVLAATTWGILRSDDGGRNWTRASAPLAWSLSRHPSRPQDLLAATGGGLLRSSDRGATWTSVALPGAPTIDDRFDRLAVAHAPSTGAVAYVFGYVDRRPMLWRRATAAGAFRSEGPLPRSDPRNPYGQAWYDWCLAVDPTNANRIFLGTIEVFRGTRSSAGRWRFVNISSRLDGDSIHPDQHDLVFGGGTPATLYAANDGGLFRSPDGGNTWVTLNGGLGITEFEFISGHPADPRWILGGTQDNGTLRHEGVVEVPPNSGRTYLHFEHVADGDGGDCDIDDGAPNVCYHTFYGLGIQRSTNGGDIGSWAPIGPSTNAASLFYPPMEVAGQLVAQAGVDLFVSTNGGGDWRQVAIPQTADTKVYGSALIAPSASVLYLGTSNGEVYDVALGAQPTLTPIGAPRPGGQVSDLEATEARPGLVWATYSTVNGPTVFRTTDNGVTWLDRTANLPRLPVNAILIDPDDLATVYIATDHGVYVTRNDGQQWQLLGVGLPNVIVGDLALHRPSRTLRAGTRNRGIWEIGV